MWFLDQIVSTLRIVSDWNYRVYRDFSDIPLIGGVLAAPFYWLYAAFYHLAIYSSSFNAWVEDATSKLGRILSLENITSYFKKFLDYASDAWEWVKDAWNTIWSEVDDWWETKKPIVQGWIDIATEGLNNLKVAWSNFWTITFPQWMTKLDTLKANWDNFWKVTFPTLISWFDITSWWDSKDKEVSDREDTKLKEREPFWKGWQDVRDNVIDFINDPLEWLAGRLENWFWGED